MNYLVTGVKKPLASVGAIVDAGNRVVFDEGMSYIENKATGERINLKRKDGTFMMEMTVERTKDMDEHMGVASGAKDTDEHMGMASSFAGQGR